MTLNDYFTHRRLDGMIQRPPLDLSSEVKYRPWSNGWAIGYAAEHPDGRIEYVYLNPSGESDDGVPTVFLYKGTFGHPAHDASVCHVALEPFESEEREYMVGWIMPIMAPSAEDAARQALAIHRDPASVATVFSVVAPDGSTTRIDVENPNDPVVIERRPPVADGTLGGAA